MYKRVLLKLSGEQLAGKFENGIDPELCGWLADEIKKVVADGTQLVVVIGGGNFIRGVDIVGHGIKRVTADQMGMLAIVINALALTDIFEAHNIETRCLSSIFAEQIVESYSYRLAEKHLANGRVLIIAAGIARPYITSDTGAVSLALELNCELVMKATKVDGVYDGDPEKNSEAKRFEQLSYQQAVENDAIKVMDKAAMGLAMEQKMPLVIFDAMQPGMIAKASHGEAVGTKIS